MVQRLAIIFGAAVVISLNACATHSERSSDAASSPPSVKQTQASAQYVALTDAIDQLIANTDPNVHIGVQVKSVTNGQVLYERDADRLFVPASVSKLFTATAAAVYLPDDFQYETPLYVEGAMAGAGQLQGDVYLQFSGDPTLTTPDLVQLLSMLKAHGITHIQGDFYIDDFIFDDVGQGPGWMWDDSAYYFGNSIDALIIDENELPLVIQRKGKRLQVTIGSDFDTVFPVRNELVAVREASTICPVQIKMNAQNEITVRGCVPETKSRIQERLAINNMMLYVQALIKNILADQDITLTGEVVVRQVPTHLQPLAIHYSKPLPVILEQVLTESHNLATASLIKKLGARYYGQPGTWEKGAAATAEILAPTGIDFTNLALVDGTGLSRYNQVRPRQVVQLLDWVYHHLSVSSQLADALAKAGKGTLSYRLLEPTVQDKVWAKTGGMTSVSSIAGYLRQDDGEMLAFMIVANGFLGNSRPYWHLEDNIIKQLVGERS